MKKEKVIVLFGKASIGKTTTLKGLIQKLLSISIVIAKSPVNTKQNINNNTDDEWIVVEINGRKIAIITSGDNYSVLDTCFSAVDNAVSDIDLYVCASRSKGGSVDYLENRFPKDDILWIQKTSVSCPGSNNIRGFQNRINNEQTAFIYDVITNNWF